MYNEYLDILERKLDPMQKKVCCRTENSIVAAGAGSGKTQVLSARFAWLVMTMNVPVCEILVLTFTNKAASEMYSRIYEILNFFALNPKTPNKERKNAQKAVEEFSEANIQTLDSYCLKIVRQAASRYGIRPDFSAGSSSSKEDIIKFAFPFILKYRNHPSVLFFAENGNLQSFAKDVFAFIIEKYTSLTDDAGYFTEKLDIQCEEISSAWNKGIKQSYDLFYSIKGVITDFPENDDYFHNIEKVIDGFDGIEPCFINSSSIKEKSSLSSMQFFLNQINLLTGIKTQKRKEPYASVKNLIKSIKNISETVFAPVNSYIFQYEYTKGLFELLDVFVQQINFSKRISGNLTFKDISSAALKILIEQKDIREQEKRAYSKIMIDEFQDNNCENRDLLFLISERNGIFTEFSKQEAASGVINQKLKNNIESNKLFFVGDEKQSIYRFRGADVSVFNELKFDLNTQPLHMVYNYRSLPSLVKGINQIFGGTSEEMLVHKGIFKQICSKEESYEAEFPKEAAAKKADLITHAEIPLEKINSSNVKIHFCMADENILEEDKKKSSADEDKNDFACLEDQIAYFTAKKIKELYENSLPGQKYYSSFAVLEKTRTDRSYFTKWLSRFGIPYTLDKQADIFADGLVSDFFNFFKLCVYPSDTCAFASVLCSPFVNISFQSLEVILPLISDGQKAPFDDCFDEELKLSLPESEYEKYQNGKDFYKINCTNILKNPLTESIEFLWTKTGYYYETLLNKNVNLLAEQYDFLFEFARRADSSQKTPAWFTDKLASIKNNNKNYREKSDQDISDIDFPLEKDDAVKIMTIHESKGLQFKKVFVYGCAKDTSFDSEGKIYYEKETGLSIKPQNGVKNYFFIKQKELSDKKEFAEFKRLIYVALTRAEEEVYILGGWKPDFSSNKPSSRKISLMEGLIYDYYREKLKNLEDYTEMNAPCFVNGAPFDFFNIPLVSKSILYFNSSKISEDSQRLLLIKAAIPIYASAKTVEIETSLLKKLTPSSLEDKYLKKVQTCGNYEEIDFIVKKYSLESEPAEFIEDRNEDNFYEDEQDVFYSEGFSFSDFGTLIHNYLEKYAGGIPFELCGIPETFFKNVSNKDIEILKNICKKMCNAFFSSELGLRFKKSKDSGLFYKTEWTFKNMIDGYIISGQIDLIFQDEDGVFIIVDYKSDRSKVPQKYYKQQTCYKIAVSQLLNIEKNKIHCCLYYLRFNEFIDISSETDIELCEKDFINAG